ncbi:MAG: hypothetical protein JW846_06265 [Dehalococcoidia bacterium]|nr:hypothetical protein [Dehalococcoidia bacterium]
MVRRTSNTVYLEAQVGGRFKKKPLKISGRAIEWNGRTWPLESLTRIGWGRQQHSRLPGGTEYDVSFGNDEEFAFVRIVNEGDFTRLVTILNETVAARIKAGLLKDLRDGKKIHEEIAQADIDDTGVQMTRRGLTTAWTLQSKYVPWTEVEIGNKPGFLRLVRRHDEKWHTDLDYTLCDNAHLLKEAIEGLIERHASRLSDLLEDE